MITDPLVRAEIAQEWTVVESLKNWSRSAALPGLMVQIDPPVEFFNLPLVLAYCALDNFLLQCIHEAFFPMPSTPGRKKPKRFQLAERMSASRSALNWIDYDLVTNGRSARNDLAHRAIVASAADCFKFINAVGAELRGWGIIS
ncbi:hypothetical protein RFM68_21645 [Mesorhizobium sp. MSK_1335]|uniref:Uncharacterized protein n=1 Tax=Mesorhizobium montanum TaxID=3072323 RepID=A0ABU4ZQ03_9HYPH|nr:hypothetical protein [Mesorhizobium sp. MSK_1335]MDX8527107.1 hypothetical protein [Mesorhizobium sp. MSK_1335]